ncbi:MAG TPA: glycosyltransferase family 4 protein [Streptosporangiaceae bacterium]|nr:glycosyltransferase family 4 protein [Streptosporangiaceae bacterium]
MRVVFLLTQDRGGPAFLTAGLARELASRPGGPEMHVLGPASVVASTGLPSSLLRPVDVRSKLDARAFSAVAKWLKNLAPDIIHAQDHRAGLVASLVAGRRSPVLLTFHGVPDSAAGRWVQGGPLHGRWPGISGRSRLMAEALVARRVTCTVAPSQAIASFLRRDLRVPANRLRVVHNGVAASHRSKEYKRVRTFATVGSFAPCKATPLLVEAFVALAANRTDLRLRMIGDGGDRRRCENIARLAPGGDQVEFAGYRTDVDAQLGHADAFVLPSVNENLPLALLQAMALGLPCIATSVGGVREVLDADCGVIVPPGDIHSLRAAMERLISEPDLAARLGQAARRRVEERFSLARCADSHLGLWSELLGMSAGDNVTAGAC